MLRVISRGIISKGVFPRMGLVNARFFHIQAPLLSQLNEKAEKHVESQHRAELTEEYANLEADEDGDEYYIDCTDIEKKWSTLSYESQQDMISYLNVKQEFGWMYLTHDEKRAIYYIAYGKWGPRDTSIMNMAESVFKLMTSGLLFAAFGFTLINYFKDKNEVARLEQMEQQ